MNQNVEEDIALIRAQINIGLLNTTVKDNLLPLATTLDNLQTTVVSLKAQAATIGAGNTQLTAAMNTISSGNLKKIKRLNIRNINSIDRSYSYQLNCTSFSLKSISGLEKDDCYLCTRYIER